MSWAMGYIFFRVGALLATGIVMYGGWSYITAPDANPNNATGDGQPNCATPEAKPFPTLLQY
jgi:hypothetical protein